MDLDLVDREQHGPLTVQLDGRTVTVPPASDLPWRVVAGACADRRLFGALVWPAGERISFNALAIVHRRWAEHNGLLPDDQMRRLVYLFERYYTGIEYDLRARLGESAGQLWRDRRWRELLGYIDQLPGDSHMNRLLANDEEHLERVMANQKEASGPSAPSMSDWSQTVSMLATLIDAVNRNTAVTQAVAGGKGPKPTYTPTPRPRTAADAVRARLQQKKHQEMNSVLLRNR